MKMYIFSSTHAATGGTELLQQFCHQLINNGIDAVMYYTERYDGSNVQNKFEPIYKNPHSNHIEEHAVAIVPETEVDNLIKLKKSFKKIYFWWLSVDNYYGSERSKCGFARQLYRKVRHLRNMKIFTKCEHFVQSEYAKKYLTDELHILPSSIYYLSDYLNDDYIQNINVDCNKKEDIILYNPKKGIEFTSKLMKEITEFEWIPLIDMTNEELKKVFSRAKVYVDFGNHPGKDRIPREAAIHYCCVITGKKGAAGNNIDIPIPEEYKIEEKENCIEKIHEKIKDCMTNYNLKKHDFDNYRDKIWKEKEYFIDCTKAMFNKKGSKYD